MLSLNINGEQQVLVPVLTIETKYLSRLVYISNLSQKSFMQKSPEQSVSLLTPVTVNKKTALPEDMFSSLLTLIVAELEECALFSVLISVSVST